MNTAVFMQGVESMSFIGCNFKDFDLGMDINNCGSIVVNDSNFHEAKTAIRARDVDSLSAVGNSLMSPSADFKKKNIPKKNIIKNEKIIFRDHTRYPMMLLAPAALAYCLMRLKENK